MCEMDGIGKEKATNKHDKWWLMEMHKNNNIRQEIDKLNRKYS